MYEKTPRGVLVAVAALLACCAAPNMDAIRSALDKGKPQKAFDLAKDDARSLDYLAVEILRRGALEGETSEAALAAIGQSRTKLKPMLRDLAAQAEDPILRARAQSLLLRMGDGGFRENLVGALDSDLGLVRAAAVEALLDLDQSRGFHERYLVDNEPQVRRAVVMFLASHKLPWSQDLLIDAARKDPDPGIRHSAIGALDPDVAENRDVLREALDSDDAALRSSAASALGSSPESLDLTWTAHLLTLPAREEGIRFASALLVADKGNEQAATYLQEALHDQSPTTRLTALVALTGAGRGVDGLDQLASDPSEQVRIAWCRLTRKLGTSNPKKRLEILEAIASGEKAGQDALVALAEEKDGYSKIRAKVWTLLKSGKPEVQRYILAHAVRPFGDPSLAIWAMKAKNPEVRFQAASAWLLRN